MAKSSRGLFRATGNKPKPVVIRNVFGELEKSPDGLPREDDDFYPTPREPIRAFLHAEGSRLRRFNSIWEPAAGDGILAKEMEEHGFKVHMSDLVDRGCGAEIGDFFKFTEPRSTAIVTNPPFALVNWRDGKAGWITHALRELGVEYMALLLNWSWPGAGGLAKVWEEFTPARVYLMRWKIDFTGQGSPPLYYGWFVWDGKSSGTELMMMDRKDGRQGTLL